MLVAGPAPKLAVSPLAPGDHVLYALPLQMTDGTWQDMWQALIIIGYLRAAPLIAWRWQAWRPTGRTQQH